MLAIDIEAGLTEAWERIATFVLAVAALLFDFDHPRPLSPAHPIAVSCQ